MKGRTSPPYLVHASICVKALTYFNLNLRMLIHLGGICTHNQIWAILSGLFIPLCLNGYTFLFISVRVFCLLFRLPNF